MEVLEVDSEAEEEVEAEEVVEDTEEVMAEVMGEDMEAVLVEVKQVEDHHQVVELSIKDEVSISEHFR